MRALDRAVQEEGGADHREMRQRLGEIAEELGLRAELLGIEPDMVAVGQQLLEMAAGLRDAPRPRQAFDIPEGTGAERAFVSVEAVVSRDSA